MVGDLDKRRFIIGYVITFSRVSIRWTSHKKQVVSFSSIEAKYNVLTKNRGKVIVGEDCYKG